MITPGLMTGIAVTQLTTGVPSLDSNIENTLHAIQREFVKTPGLRLTSAQAQRLLNIDALVCDALLASLVDVGFLVRRRDGTFLRAAPIAEQ
jgi:hypothetical protein